MKIGILKKFGLKNENGILFGFLMEPDGEEDGVYFNEKLIAPASKFKERYRKGCLVVYEVQQLEDGRKKAYGVKLLEELNREEQLCLYRQCRDENRDAELKLLRDDWGRPRKAPGNADTHANMGIVRKFGLKDQSGGSFGFLKDALLGEREIYFDEGSLSPGLEKLYRREKRERNHGRRHPFLKDEKVIYWEQRKNNRWSVNYAALPQELDEQTLRDVYREWRDRSLNQGLAWLLRSVAAPLEQESDEDLVFLILRMKTGNCCVSCVLKHRPELLWTSPEVCACIDGSDIRDAFPSQRITTDEQVAFMAQYVLDKDAWRAIVSMLPDRLVLRCQQALGAVHPARAVSFLSGVDWTAAGEAELAHFRILLTCMNWSSLTESEMAMVTPLLERVPDAYIVSLIAQKQSGWNSSSLLAWKPDLLWTSPEVCNCIIWDDVKKLPLDQLIPENETDCRHTLLARFNYLFSCSLRTSYFASHIAPLISLLEREPDGYIVSLATQTRAEGKGISALLEWKPELLWTSPEVCACVQPKDIENLPLGQLIRTDEQAAFLAEHTGEDAWCRISRCLSGTVLLHCRRAMEHIDPRQALRLLANINWAIANEEDLAQGCTLLAKIDWSYPDKSLMAAIDPLLKRRSYEDIVFLVTQTRAEGKGVSALLEWKPELLWTSPEVCACVQAADIRNLPLEQLVQRDEQAAFLAEHAGEGVWSSISSKLSGAVLLHCRKAMDIITKDQASALLAQADWTDTTEDNLEDHGPLLAKLHWDSFPDAIMAAAASLYMQGMELESCWWQRMTNSMKIRLLMYLSIFAKEEQAARRWSQSLQRIQSWEDEQKNRLVSAVLQFFAGIYAKTGAEYQNNFLKAHGMLMKYITDCFTQGLDVTSELSSLLERCRDDFRSVNYFCDGRIWQNANAVYCPGEGRPCRYYKNMDLTRTRFRTTDWSLRGHVDHKQLSFMDFLLNIGGIPELDKQIGIRRKDEYPFRVSAYVNSLIRLRSHMKCSHCGELFYPKFEYTKLITAKLPITVFYCSKSDQEGTHDHGVYLNFCYHCHKIIDSRECRCREKLSDSREFEGVVRAEAMTGPASRYGQYLCMHCGGSAHIDPKISPVCPNCGCDDPTLVSRTRKGGIHCEGCGYESSAFRSIFEGGLHKDL